MKQLNYSQPNNLSQLHDEILAVHPELLTTMRVEGQGKDIWLTIPDDADSDSIDAVVAAHIPRQRPDPGSAMPFDWAALRLSFEQSEAWERIGDAKPLRAARLETTLWQFGENPQLLADIQRQWNAAVVAANPTADELDELRMLLSDLFAYLQATMGVEVAIAADGSLTI